MARGAAPSSDFRSLCDSFMPHDFSCANLRAIVWYITHFHSFLSITWASADVYGLIGIIVLAKEGLLMVQEGGKSDGWWRSHCRQRLCIDEDLKRGCISQDVQGAEVWQGVRIWGQLVLPRPYVKWVPDFVQFPPFHIWASYALSYGAWIRWRHGHLPEISASLWCQVSIWIKSQLDGHTTQL